MPKITSVNYYEGYNDEPASTSITMKFDDLDPQKLLKLMGGEKEDYGKKVSKLYSDNKKDGAR